ncbi:MAG: NAD(P)H-hydrate epimerase [Clostridia bacterium]|nr:NAD(P)H-hydrate epimerase [Clostridia bacterium]
METVTCSEMKAMDSYAIKAIGIPGIVLMEHAALRVIDAIDLQATNSFTVVCGTGNNGGDGLAITRHLILKSKRVDVFVVGNLDKTTADFNTNLTILKNLKPPVSLITDDSGLAQLEKSLKNNDLTIDALFGIGLTRDIRGLFYKVIESINKYSKRILSVDIPSGMDGDNGQVKGICVKADQTVTFHRIKAGLVENKTHTGDIIVVDIGIPDMPHK